MTGGPPTILVVDDEPRALQTLRRVLDEDFRVLTANDAEEAIAVLETEFVQVVLSDQRMPGTTGVELLRRVRTRWPDVVRLIISGYTDPADMMSAINDAGIYQFVHILAARRAAAYGEACCGAASTSAAERTAQPRTALR